MTFTGSTSHVGWVRLGRRNPKEQHHVGNVFIGLKIPALESYVMSEALAVRKTVKPAFLFFVFGQCSGLTAGSELRAGS